MIITTPGISGIRCYERLLSEILALETVVTRVGVSNGNEQTD